MRILLALCVLLSGIASAAQPGGRSDFDLTPKEYAEAERTTKDGRAAVAAELKTLKDHAWAGEYYTGDGLGQNIAFELAPEAGFFFQLSGCVGVYDRNHGAVVEKNGVLHLDCAFPNDSPAQLGNPPELIPVHWGQRHYLILAVDVIGFCNLINQGSEPRTRVHGACLLRRGDEKISVTGSPDLPEKYRPYLLSMPVEAEIIAIGQATTRAAYREAKYIDTAVTINKGTNDGLLVGMQLWVTEPDDVWRVIKIIGEGPERSEAVTTHLNVDGKAVPTQVGWKLSTLSWRAAGSKNPMQ